VKQVVHPRKSTHISNDVWFYEEPKGFCVVANGKIAGYIRWPRIRAAVKRKDAIAKQRASRRQG
jgi:hypothetical protein